MFKFSTTTIINSDLDLNTGKAMFSSIAADDNHGAILKIKRDFTFEMPGITKVFKKVAAEPTFAEFTIDCDALIALLPTDTVYPVSGRIAIYMVLEGSEESVFANDFYQKGYPFSLGFLVKDADVTGTDLATALQKIALRFDINTLGRKLFDVTVSGSTLTFKCVDEYMRFKAVAALEDLGDHEAELVHMVDGETDNTQSVITVVERGTNGFGTFRHLMKDLRLPTATATSWTALRKNDRPVPGALYNQYIIYYEAPSGTNPSLVAVGHETVSRTTHVFWVRQDYSDSFEAVVAEVVGSSAVQNDKTAIFEEV